MSCLRHLQQKAYLPQNDLAYFVVTSVTKKNVFYYATKNLQQHHWLRNVFCNIYHVIFFTQNETL
jgi:hypothetical protein